MERYFYASAEFEHELEWTDDRGCFRREAATSQGYAVWDRKLGHRDDLRLCWTTDHDWAQKIVDALNKADAS